jgi:beta-galactosidase
MIHLLPHWNWPGREGTVIPVIAYTNCDTVELFVNGKSFGAKAYEFPRQGNAGGWNSYARPPVAGTTADLHLSWDVPYAPGTLKAVGRNAGQIVCETEMKTAGTPATIELAVDHPSIRADSRDVAHFTVRILDAQGVLVPNANPTITFDLQGPAKIIGTDNGDLADLGPPTSKDRKAFNGMALAIIQSSNQSGKIRMIARGGGLKEAAVEVESSSVPSVK